MNRVGFLKGLTACLAVTVLGSLQPWALAADAPRSGVIDVELREGGVLLGQVVDQHGLPLADAQVTLLDGNRQLATTRTDRRGFFVFRALRGGVYGIAAAGGVGVYRVWAPGTAPPSVQPAALLVAGVDLVRGQYRKGSLACLGAWAGHQLASPLGLAAVLATGIAVPLSIHSGRPKGGVPVSPP